MIFDVILENQRVLMNFFGTYILCDLHGLIINLHPMVYSSGDFMHTEWKAINKAFTGVLYVILGFWEF